MFLVRILLYPLSLLYQFIFYIVKKRTHTTSLGIPLVISVGNLSVGGTGKTPFIIELATAIRNLYPKINLTVLSRGYGGKMSATGCLVNVDSNPRDSGDEPLLIKKRLPFLEVIIGKDRVQAFKNWSSRALFEKDRVVLLDDGFQHFAIYRHFDIVLIDSTKLLGSGFTIPIGSLREKFTSISRAHLIVFTRFNKENLPLKNLKKMESMVKRMEKINPDLLLIHAKEVADGLEIFQNDRLVSYPASYLKNKNVFAFCGLGNPSPFFKEVEFWVGEKIEVEKFPDHYELKERDWDFLEQKNAEFYVCTEKDYVKIPPTVLQRFSGKIGYIKIHIEILESKPWMKILKTLLDQHLGKQIEELAGAHSTKD